MHALTFTEGFAISAGLVQLFVGAMFMRFRFSQAHWGLGWWGVVFILGGVLNLLAPVFLSPAKIWPNLWQELLTALLGFTIMGSLVAGGRLYNGHHKPGPVVVFIGTWVVYVVLALLARMSPWYTDAIPNYITSLFFIYLAVLCLGSMRREAGAGHGVAAGALLAYTPLIAVGSLFGWDPIEIRYWSAVPFALAGIGVLAATMGRMRAHLRDLNESLELRVAERTQELRQIITSLESFNSMVSHDLRGPLGGMAGLSEIALDALKSGDTERAQRLFAVVQQQSATLSTLVSDLLSLAKVSHADLQAEWMALNEVVQEAKDMLDLANGDGSTDVVTVDTLPMVVGDRMLMRQVFVNLIGNALKFSRDANPSKVQVAAHRVNGKWRVTVQDNGIGFDPARAAELFEPFKRLHGHLPYEGTGLGLPLVQRIIARHHGRMGAESTEGRGATFWFELPNVAPKSSA